MATQQEAIEKLERNGYEFSNWIPSCPDAEGQPAEGTESNQTAVMVKRTRGRSEYHEVEPDGTVN